MSVVEVLCLLFGVFTYWLAYRVLHAGSILFSSPPRKGWLLLLLLMAWSGLFVTLVFSPLWLYLIVR